MKLLKPKEAARELHISYPTIKKWIYQGKIQTIITPGGHHRVPVSEIERLTRINENSSPIKKKQQDLASELSVRNRLTGLITEITHDGLFSEIKMDVEGQEITAIITREGCLEMNLKEGTKALALFKATEVMMSQA